VPEGSLTTASNLIIDRDDTIETRRGLEQYGTLLTYPFQQMYDFDGTLMGWDTNHKFWYDSDGLGTWITLSGTYTAPSDVNRIKGAEAAQNFYFATSTGIIGLTAPSSTLYQAGVPYPLDSTATLNATVGGWLTTSQTVGYRMILGYTDSNSNLHVGPPAQRLVVSNPAAGSDSTVTVKWYLPSGTQPAAGWFYQIYRTKLTAFVSSVAQDPGDECYLVVQKTLTSTDISNGYVTYTDATPDSLLGQTLYTNPSQQTIAGANFAPPLAKDITYYAGNMLYANTLTKQQAIINMITTPTVNDTITIGGVVYTAKGSETIASGFFKVFSTGTPGENIDNTARSLVRVINGYASNTTYWAIYTSGYTSLPGQITLQERVIGGAAFPIISSAGTVYSPQIPVSGTTYSSTNNVNPHYLYVSKIQIPEAVPLPNFIPIGTSDKAIIRVLALRSSIFVFKEDGVYRILGTDITNFSVSLFDSTVVITAPDSAVLLNNQIWCYTNQGVVAVSDSGSVIMSRPIEHDLVTLSSSIYPHFASATFGVRYESDRHYNLFTPTQTSDTTATQDWVYNFLTACWTNWPISATAGIVTQQPDDHLYLCYPTGQVVRERKNWDIFDYADFEYAVTITSSSGVTVHLASTTNIAAGDSLYQEDALGNFVGQSIIVSVDSATQITMTDIIGWANSAAIVYQPIAVNATYTPIGADFAWVKHFQDFQVMFREATFTNLQIGFASDLDAGTEYTTILPLTGSGFGTVPFGNGPFGGVGTIAQVARTLVPRNKARCHWMIPSINHSEALSNFAINGMNFYFQYVSARTK
jgi:hypothetical protein